MSFVYKDNKQVSVELKKLMMDNDVSQREIAERLNLSPQGLAKLLNKKMNFGFSDTQKILASMDYHLEISFKKNHD